MNVVKSGKNGQPSTEYVGPVEAAKLACVARSTLDRAMLAGQIPAATVPPFGRRVLLRSDVETWIADRQQR